MVNQEIKGCFQCEKARWQNRRFSCNETKCPKYNMLMGEARVPEPKYEWEDAPVQVKEKPKGRVIAEDIGKFIGEIIGYIFIAIFTILKTILTLVLNAAKPRKATKK